MFVAWIILGVLVLLALALLFFTRWSYGKSFYVPDEKKKIDPHTLFQSAKYTPYESTMSKLVDAVEECPYEQVSIVSHDGLKLVGYYYPISKESRVLHIFFHGWRSSGVRDSCGGHKLAREAGHNILIVDQRAHGDSEGNTLTFGIREKYDCRDWVNYAIERFGSDIQIVLHGMSMGAATVLMASSLDLPKNVKGIIADCGYSSPEAILRKCCKGMGISDHIGYPMLCLAARLFGKFSLNEDRGGAIEAVKHTSIPIMIVHGEDDDFVPFSMCREIYEACASPNKKLLTVPGAAHGVSFFVDTPTYTREVAMFEQAILK